MIKEIKLLNHQYNFLIAERNTLLVAGYSAGKSFAGTVKTIYMKMQYPTKKVAYYLPNYGLVRDIAFDKFPEILNMMGLEHKLNKSDKEIHIKDYGTIIFRSMENPETIVGFETAYALIDEADILTKEKMTKVYQKILGRNRAVENARVDAVSTPESFKWLYEQSRSGHFNVIRAKTMDNKHTPLDYIEELKKQYPEQLLNAYLNGEFVNLTRGTVFKYFKRALHLTDRVEDDSESLHIGQDFNIGSCISIVHIRDGIDLFAVNEVVSYDTAEIITNLKELYPNRNITIYPDASGDSRKTSASKTDIQMLKDAGFKVCVDSRNPSIKDRVNIQNNLFDKNRYFINENRCPRLIEAFEQHSYDEKTQAPQKFNSHPAIDDFTDSATYCSAYLFPIREKSSITSQIHI